MAEAIPDFLAEATRLYEHILHLDAEALHHEGEQFHASFCRAFDALADRLIKRNGVAVEPQNADGQEQRLTKSCWKITQDILLRFRRTNAGELDQIDHVEPVSYALDWTVHDTEALGTRLLEFSEQLRQLRPEDDKTTRLMHKLSSLRPIHEVTTPTNQLPPTSTATLPTASTSSSILVDFILESLSFKSMKNREEEVADAHSNTFDWIFKYSFGDVGEGGFGDQFSRWLQSDELGSTYWITGKPGSGKSTIMRYISEHKMTARLLRSWAGKSQLVKANFYFWTSGSEEQRSQTGLLRYLLHQLLSSSLDLVPTVFPELWQKLSAMTTKERIRFSVEWSVRELMDGFHRFLERALESKKICLFVDGLDEFDGDHQEIIRFFKKIAQDGDRKSIKLCLSSRPWPVFEKAFEYAVPNLKLQDLTFQDMATYVADHLGQNVQIKQLICEKENVGDLLVRDIVNRAEGVFLWVRLVVRKILEIHGNDPDLTRIRVFLHSLPSDLDNLFDKLLFQDQTQAEITETSHTFQLVHAREVVANFIKDESSNSLTIWELAFSLDAENVSCRDDGDFREVEDDEILLRCRTTLERLNASSTGLLETYMKRTRGNLFQSTFSRLNNDFGKRARDLAESRVTYLHRTVRDYFITKPGVWSNIMKHSAVEFDPHQRLIQSHCQRLRYSIEPIEHHRRLDEWYPEIALSLSHARYMTYTSTQKTEQIDLVDQLEHGISWYWQSRPGDDNDHWAKSCFGTYELRKGNKLIISHPFLALCTKFGLEQYVLATLDRLAEESHIKMAPNDKPTSWIEEETPLLSYALEFLTSRQKTIMPLSSPTFVKSLLDNSHLHHPVLGRLIGKPNMEFNSPIKKKQETTPWLLTLSQLRDAKRRGWIEPFDVSRDGTHRWTRIVKSLMQEGQADGNAFLKWNGFDEECYAQDVLSGRKQLGGIDDWWIQQLGQAINNE